MSTDVLGREKNEPLPHCTMVITCDECGEQVGELDTNTWTLAGVIMRLRREHAASKHGWQRVAP
jgi:hypothetical protein